MTAGTSKKQPVAQLQTVCLEQELANSGFPVTVVSSHMVKLKQAMSTVLFTTSKSVRKKTVQLQKKMYASSIIVKHFRKPEHQTILMPYTIFSAEMNTLIAGTTCPTHMPSVLSAHLHKATMVMT
jgi:hypothetical protein